MTRTQPPCESYTNDCYIVGELGEFVSDRFFSWGENELTFPTTLSHCHLSPADVQGNESGKKRKEASANHQTDGMNVVHYSRIWFHVANNHCLPEAFARFDVMNSYWHMLVDSSCLWQAGVTPIGPCSGLEPDDDGVLEHGSRSLCRSGCGSP